MDSYSFWAISFGIIAPMSFIVTVLLLARGSDSAVSLLKMKEAEAKKSRSCNEASVAVRIGIPELQTRPPHSKCSCETCANWRLKHSYKLRSIGWQ